jgi:hypothetical protein
MPCYHIPGGIICGKLGQHCRDCGEVSGFLCDYPVGDKTCNRPMCEEHATQVGRNRHYCRLHKNAVGVSADLFA